MYKRSQSNTIMKYYFYFLQTHTELDHSANVCQGKSVEQMPHISPLYLQVMEIGLTTELFITFGTSPGFRCYSLGFLSQLRPQRIAHDQMTSTQNKHAWLVVVQCPKVHTWTLSLLKNAAASARNQTCTLVVHSATPWS